MNDGQRLLVRQKPADLNFDQRVLRALTSDNLGFKIFNATNPQLRRTAVEWAGHIDFEILDGAFHPDDYLARCAQGATGFGRSLVDKLSHRVSRAVAQQLVPLRRRHALEPLLCCSRCRGDVRIAADRVRCDRCNGHYPRDGDLYFLSRDRFTPAAP